VPNYDYRCKPCDLVVERNHPVDANPAPCECGSALTRVWASAALVFRGSGFYVNDSRLPVA
jgi:putative FmdB family regulatory protein